MDFPSNRIHWHMPRGCLQSIYVNGTPEHLVDSQVAMVKETAAVKRKTLMRAERDMMTLGWENQKKAATVYTWNFYSFTWTQMLLWSFSQGERAAETILGQGEVSRSTSLSLLIPPIFSIVSFLRELVALHQGGNSSLLVHRSTRKKPARGVGRKIPPMIQNWAGWSRNVFVYQGPVELLFSESTEMVGRSKQA